jgi:hypothetical protein
VDRLCRRHCSRTAELQSCRDGFPKDAALHLAMAARTRLVRKGLFYVAPGFSPPCPKICFLSRQTLSDSRKARGRPFIRSSIVNYNNYFLTGCLSLVRAVLFATEQAKHLEVSRAEHTLRFIALYLRSQSSCIPESNSVKPAQSTFFFSMQIFRDLAAPFVEAEWRDGQRRAERHVSIGAFRK